MIQNPQIKIRILREMKGYTQENMANELKISTKAYQKIESGETQLTIAKLNAISAALEIEPLDILNFNEESFFEKLKHNVPVISTSKILPNNAIPETVNGYINSLKEEIAFLRKIISKNLDL